MTLQQIANKLLGLKQDIDEAKTEKAKIQGTSPEGEGFS